MKFLVEKVDDLSSKLSAAEENIETLKTMVLTLMTKKDDNKDQTLLEDKINDVEDRVSKIEISIQDNDDDVEMALDNFDLRISENDDDISALDMIVSDNMKSIAMNTANISTSMVSISANADSFAKLGITYATIENINNNIAKNSVKTMSNMRRIA